MIDIKELTNEDIGKTVFYHCSDSRKLIGYITGWSKFHIFVKISGNIYPNPISPSLLFWDKK